MSIFDDLLINKFVNKLVFCLYVYKGQKSRDVMIRAGAIIRAGVRIGTNTVHVLNTYVECMWVYV